MALALRLAAKAGANLEKPQGAFREPAEIAHVFVKVRGEHGAQAVPGVQPEDLLFHDRALEDAHFFKADAAQDDGGVHLQEARPAQGGGKAFLKPEHKGAAFAVAQVGQTPLLGGGEPGFQPLVGAVALRLVREIGQQVPGGRADFAKPPLLFFAEFHWPPPSPRRTAPDFLRNTVP